MYIDKDIFIKLVKEETPTIVDVEIVEAHKESKIIFRMQEKGKDMIGQYQIASKHYIEYSRKHKLNELIKGLV